MYWVKLFRDDTPPLVSKKIVLLDEGTPPVFPGGSQGFINAQQTGDTKVFGGIQNCSHSQSPVECDDSSTDNGVW